MEWTTGPLVIDARPRGPRGPLANELVQGRSLLDRVLDLAVALTRNTEGPISVMVRADDELLLRPSIEGHPSGRFVLAESLPSGSAILRTDRLYDLRALRKAIRRAGDPEVAALWRIDGHHGLAGADAELARGQSAAPLGRYWAVRPARWLARALATTLVHPNTLTILAFSGFLGSAALVAFLTPTPAIRLTTAGLLAFALILNKADGHLARLQGTASSFGRWLSDWLGNVGDLAFHAAIAWSASARGKAPGWLLLGMLYPMGKYLFTFGAIGATDLASTPSSIPRAGESISSRGLRVAGLADVRWNLWVVLAGIGRLDLALAGYAIYYPLGAIRKVARRA